MHFTGLVRRFHSIIEHGWRNDVLAQSPGKSVPLQFHKALEQLKAVASPRSGTRGIETSADEIDLISFRLQGTATGLIWTDGLVWRK